VLFRDLTARRSEELTAYYVGEETAALLPYADVAHAVVIADAIRNAIRSLKIEHSGNRTGFVTVSAGVDERMPIRSVGEPMELILAADKALDKAKCKEQNRALGANSDFRHRLLPYIVTERIECRAFNPLPRWLHPCPTPSSRRASAAPPSRITASWFHWKTGRNSGANAFIHARFVRTHQS
jgi:hypothetical protein